MRIRNITRRFPRLDSAHVFRGRRPTFERLEDRRVLAVDFVSAFSVGSDGDDNIRDVVMDGAGNTLVVGKFTGAVDFDPGPGTYGLTSSPAGSRNSYVAKYDPSGNVLWAQRLGGDASDSNDREIAADSAGNVYLAGGFTGSADFGSITLTSFGMTDAFVTKLDAGGNFLWSKQFGGANVDWGHGVAVDNTGNVLLIGQSSSAASGNPDAFIAKFAPDGSKIWDRAVGASSSTKGKGGAVGAYGFNVTVDNGGAIYATGNMFGTVDFDPSTGTTALSGQAFVIKLTSGGNLAWARTFTRGGSTPSDPIVRPADICVDANGNVYSTGYYTGAVDFDPGTQKSQKFVLDTGSGWIKAAYVNAIDSNGNFLWAKSTRWLGSTNAITSTVPNAIALDGLGGIYLAGSFEGDVDFDASAGTFGLISSGATDAVIWKLDTSGNFVWANHVGGTGSDSAHGIGADGAGNILVAGTISNTAEFDPGPGTYNLTSAGGYDYFVAKFTQTSSLSLASGSAASSSANLLAVSVASDTADVATKTKPSREVARPQKRIDWAASIDAALEQIDYVTRPKIVAEITLDLW